MEPDSLVPVPPPAAAAAAGALWTTLVAGPVAGVFSRLFVRESSSPLWPPHMHQELKADPFICHALAAPSALSATQPPLHLPPLSI